MTALTPTRPALAEDLRPVALPLSPPAAPTLYEIRWTDGTVTGPFLEQDDAVDAALDINQRFDISPDLEITSPDADEDGLSSYREGEIREVGDGR